MAGDPGDIEAGSLGAGTQHSRRHVWGEVFQADRAGPDPGEQRSGDFAAELSPGSQGGDGVGAGVLAVGHGDVFAVAFLIGLGTSDGQEQTGGFVVDIGEGEGHELGDPQGGGVAERDDRGVAGPDGGGAVDGRDDLADVVKGDGSGEAAGCGAVGAGQSAAYLADGFGGDRVEGSGLAVDVTDHGA
ncbi:MAG: hypothetical protein V9G04_11025 [Nocardioides sp.]